MRLDLIRRIARLRRRLGASRPRSPPPEAPPRWADVPVQFEPRADRAAAYAARRLETPPTSSSSQPSITAITLNRDGGEHLRALLTSLEHHVRYPRWELAVVDHASSDDSRQVVRAFAERLPVRLVEKDANDSFSKSNNDVALSSTADLLFFLNNDIVFRSDVFSALAQSAMDPNVGLVGLELLHPDDRGGRVHHAGIDFISDPSFPFPRPTNSEHAPSGEALERVPAVTAAAAFVRRADFLKVGGFDEDFEYGYEDVELALRLGWDLGRVHVFAPGVRAIHDESATQRGQVSDDVRLRRRLNRRTFADRVGPRLRHAFWRDKIAAARDLSTEPLVVGLAVTEVGAEAKAGDYFTASELGVELEKLGWHVRYLARRGGDWYDARGLDVLISLVHQFDPTKVHSARGGLLKIAWARNHFDTWPRQTGFEAYDLVLASSTRAVRAFLVDHDRAAAIFNIATNPARFAAGHARPELVSDLAFTGSYWNVHRDVLDNLRPERFAGRSVGFFGSGWSKTEDPAIQAADRGFVPYADLPDVYASAGLVVDDATESTRLWGSVNSRVFDALAAGRLVVTNGEAGAADLFGDRLPTYASPEDLVAVASRWLDDPKGRARRAAELRDVVLAEHTYAVRARQLQSILLDFVDTRLRIAIKAPIPRAEVAEKWGDLHFARALRRALQRLGHAARIDLMPDWYSPDAAADDVVISLRGRSAYEPDPGHVNLMWMISHPDEIDPKELSLFDHVFVASEPYARALRAREGNRVSALLQAFDTRHFRPPEPDVVRPHHELLFVGNSRFVDRPGVLWSVERDLPLSVYGGQWQGRIPAEIWKRDHLANAELPRYYAGADIVLNDHWPDMAREGFLSNRLFDAAACGACIVSDEAEGLDAVFGGAITTFDSADRLEQIVHRLLADPEERARKGAAARAAVEKSHTFDARAERILEVAAPLVAARRARAHRR